MAGEDQGGADNMQWKPWDWPFFDGSHQALAERLMASPYRLEGPHEDLAAESRKLAGRLAADRLLDVVVPPLDGAGGGAGGRRIDVRSLCLVREALAYDNALADNVFVMQGIGTVPLWMHGAPAQQDAYLEPARRGERIAAFALTETEAGSDVAAVTTTARQDGDSFILDGEKNWISNAGFADHYLLVARTGEAQGARGLSMFIVDADAPGLEIGPPVELLAPHPVGQLLLDGCRVPASRLVGAPGEGFKIAMQTFDIFRSSVGAAAIGMARRALDETLARVKTRRLFGQPMAQLQGVQMKIAEMATELESAALTVYHAAWAKDVRGGRCSREASMAKLLGTEAAFRVVDAAVQLFGGLGVKQGCIVEQLYRDVRPLRIYEGASEIQKLVIARGLLAD
jgi:acyl-CoA dehydrogenase